MLLQIILEIGITLAIKIDQLRLCFILNNYIATHITDYLHHFSSGSSPCSIVGLTDWNLRNTCGIQKNA